jgi:hypothetical protein
MTKKETDTKPSAFTKGLDFPCDVTANQVSVPTKKTKLLD